jgi:hypothetical protein
MLAPRPDITIKDAIRLLMDMYRKLEAEPVGSDPENGRKRAALCLAWITLDFVKQVQDEK